MARCLVNRSIVKKCGCFGVILLMLVGVACAVAPASAAQAPSSLTVSAAISLKDVLDELGHSYTHHHPGVKVVFNYGGSGTLQHQIEQGAPVDIFVSAAEKQMDALAAEDLLAAGTRRDIARNTLVLITPAHAAELHDFAGLTRDDVKIIALGEPATVPAGAYAQQTLEHLGVFAAIQKKIVYAKDVRAVLTYVETGNADAGVVYATDAKISSKVRVVATAPENSHDPIVYPAAVLKASKSPDAARSFLAFLAGPQARVALEKYGFVAAENQPAQH